MRSIVPPYVLEAIAANGSDAQRERAVRTLAVDAVHRAARAGRSLPEPAAAPADTPQRTISDAANGTALTGLETLRAEGDPPTGDAAVDEAYDGLGATWTFYWRGLRPQLDRRRGPAAATASSTTAATTTTRSGTAAGWSSATATASSSTASPLARRHRPRADPRRHRARGRARLPGPVRRAQRVDLRRLRLAGQAARARPDRRPGRLADRRRTARGRRQRHGAALDEGARHRLRRSRARQGPAAGAHADYVDTTEDNGGVHINSGIPNRAFATLAIALGGQSWTTAGAVWYETLRDDRLQTGADLRPVRADHPRGRHRPLRRSDRAGGRGGVERPSASRCRDGRPPALVHRARRAARPGPRRPHRRRPGARARAALAAAPAARRAALVRRAA